MTRLVDYRELACPEPAVQTNKSLAEAQKVTSIVDNSIARVNVSRVATNGGWSA